MKQENNFLIVDNSYFKLTAYGLKSTDILVLAKIAEFNRNKCKCYLTNSQFAEITGESVRTIARVLERLESWRLIKRTKADKIRSLEINKTTIKMLTPPAKKGSDKMA